MVLVLLAGATTLAMIGRRVEKLARKGLARVIWEIAQIPGNRETSNE